MTRGERLPPVPAGGYLIDILFEIGPVKPTGMGGTVPMGEPDLHAWQCNQGVELTAWEARTLRVMAREYSAMLTEASEPTCPPPYVAADFINSDKRKKIAEAMSKWADGLNQQKKR